MTSFKTMTLQEFLDDPAETIHLFTARDRGTTPTISVPRTLLRALVAQGGPIVRDGILGQLLKVVDSYGHRSKVTLRGRGEDPAAEDCDSKHFISTYLQPPLGNICVAQDLRADSRL